MAHDVFISYSFADQKIVEGLSAYLEQHGIRCFVAYRDIPRGKNWAEYIPPAIENCKMMVYVHSSTANESEMINKEIALCLEYKRPILPFKISDIKYAGAKAFHLVTINWIDAFPNPKEYFGELLTSIKNLFPEFETGIRKREKEQEEEKRIEQEEKEIEGRMSKDDIGLMKLLSKIGLFVIPLIVFFGIGMFGSLCILLAALFGLFHSAVAIRKNITGITKTKIITLFGVASFLYLFLIAVKALIFTENHTVSDILAAPTFFVGLFGIIYSIVWVRKLNRMAKNYGYNIKELQKQSFTKYQKTIIAAIIVIIVVFVILS